MLAAGLAHDLNNMLGAIAATAELVAARHIPGSSSARDLAAITEQAARAGALIRQILAFSRQEILRPASTSFGAILASMGTTLAALTGQQARLEIALGADMPLHADAAALERVILNLVLNARDAIAQAGNSQPHPAGRIRINTGQATRSDLPAAAPFMAAADYGWLSVSDDGPGVPAAHAARIFEPYFTTRPHGQGLGLSTAYGLVKQSGGYLLLDDSPEGGARFTLYLPIAPAKAEARPIQHPPQQTPLLLLVEDESLLRLSASRALEAAGFRVLPVASAEAALAAYRATPGIAALLTDIRLGGMDGIALTRQLRQASPDLPVLLMSGYADAVARDAVCHLDVAFLAKPFSLHDLRHSIAAIL